MHYIVCARVGYFADDVPARCATCDAAIVHRPHVPPALVPLCEACFAALVVFGAAPPRIAVTQETVREVALYYATPNGGTQ